MCRTQRSPRGRSRHRAKAGERKEKELNHRSRRSSQIRKENCPIFFNQRKSARSAVKNSPLPRRLNRVLEQPVRSLRRKSECRRREITSVKPKQSSLERNTRILQTLLRGPAILLSRLSTATARKPASAYRSAYTGPFPLHPAPGQMYP